MIKTALTYLIILSLAFLQPTFFFSKEELKQEKESVYCSQCGQKNMGKAKFCKACGKPIIPIDPSRYVKNFKKKKKYLTNEEKQSNINRASKAVVRVKIKSPVQYRQPLFGSHVRHGRYNSDTVVVQEREAEAVEIAGSGFFVSSDGYIVTNSHVATPYNTDADIEIETYDGQKYDAKLIGSDQATDIAILKINAQNLQYLEWIDPDEIKVGEELWAIGNPLDVGLSTTKGIFSSKATLRAGFRQIENFLSIDVKITHGNSGGPTVDCFGQVIGVNDITMGSSAEALNYCISSTLARKITEDLIDDGTLSRSFLGLGMSVLNERTANKFNIPYKRGVVIEYIIPESPAERIGILPGDLIFEVADETSLTTFAVQNKIIDLAVGSQVSIKFMRGENAKMANITTEKRPEFPRLSDLQDLERHLEGEFKINDKGKVLFTNINEFGLAARNGLKLDTVIQKFFPAEYWEVRDKDWNKIKDHEKPIKVDSLETLALAISKSYLDGKIAFIMEGKDVEGDYIFFPIIIIERPMIIA